LSNPIIGIDRMKEITRGLLALNSIVKAKKIQERTKKESRKNRQRTE